MDGGATAAGVPSACWRIGPVALGMSRRTVRDRMGPPDASDTARLHVGAGRSPLEREDVYLFPRDLGARLAREPAAGFSPKVLVLSYRGDALAQIDTTPGYSAQSGRCADGRPAPAPRDDGDAAAPADFEPFRSFAGVRVGDSFKVLARRLGAADVNTSGDVRTFDPAPLRVEGEAAVDGFTVSADRAVMLVGYTPELVLHRRAADCRIDGFRLDTARPEG